MLESRQSKRFWRPRSVRSHQSCMLCIINIQKEVMSDPYGDVTLILCLRQFYVLSKNHFPGWNHLHVLHLDVNRHLHEMFYFHGRLIPYKLTFSWLLKFKLTVKLSFLAIPWGAQFHERHCDPNIFQCNVEAFHWVFNIAIFRACSITNAIWL